MATQSKQHWNRKEVAEALGMHPNTISRHIKAGKLNAAKPGRKFLITRSDLVDYLGSEEQVNDIFGKEDNDE